MYVLQAFERDSKLSFSNHKTDIDSSRSWRLPRGKPVRRPQNFMTTQKLKKSVVWKYFGFITAKDGPATKTNLDMTKATYKLYLKSYASKGEHSFNNKYVFLYM
jgi:hypothetical protein